MPFFTADHLAHTLSYLPSRTHPSLVSFLAMLKEKVPIADAPSQAFGSKQERVLLRDYFSPEGGPTDRPWYVPFGPPRAGDSNWKPKGYGGTSLQRMRTGKPFIYLQGTGAKSDLWSLHPNLVANLKSRGGAVIGSIPISVHNLAAWCYRLHNVDSHKAAIERFVNEFDLEGYGLLGDIFETDPDLKLEAIPLSPTPLGSAQILDLLEPPPIPEPVLPEEGSAGTASLEDEAADVEGEDHTWEVDAEDVRAALGSLRGLDAAAFQAISALRAGMHVIFTGPPGTGKTQLASRLCAASGIPHTMVAATDQWTTVDTIGGYFPSATAPGQLEFLPGFVVSAVLSKKSLIIDEINRADIDKAFGELFTLLSGKSVDLPYIVRSKDEDGGPNRRIRLAPDGSPEDPSVETIALPAWWRLIGSMNDADKASLKRLSYAFIRRFAFVPISIPPASIYEELLDAGAGSGADGLAATRPDLLQALKDLFASPSGLASIDMAMGYAIPEAMMRQARSEISFDTSRSTEVLLLSALDLYVAPQFQGRADKHEALLSLIGKHLANATTRDFGRRLAVWTGFID